VTPAKIPRISQEWEYNAFRIVAEWRISPVWNPQNTT
jgi:hypothetical protein